VIKVIMVSINVVMIMHPDAARKSADHAGQYQQEQCPPEVHEQKAPLNRTG
jgi:hypothetical protein